MAFPDDMEALRVRGEQLRADRDAAFATLTDDLFTALRSRPRLTWLDDAGLRVSCEAFAGAAIRTKIPPQQLT